MKIKRVEHIAIAVTSLKQSIDLLRDTFGLPLEYEEQIGQTRAPLLCCGIAFRKAHWALPSSSSSIRSTSSSDIWLTAARISSSTTTGCVAGAGCDEVVTRGPNAPSGRGDNHPGGRAVSKPEVVITGLGIVSPYGCDVMKFNDRLAAGEPLAVELRGAQVPIAALACVVL
jgi:hypothetical protein